MSKDVILQAEDLVKYYPIKTGVIRRTTGHVQAVDGVSFELYKGETLGVVGESGCGKSTLGRLLMRLEEPTSGRVLFEGRDMYAQKGAAMRRLRRDIQIVFQDPYTSLNPRMTVGDIIGEPFDIHPDVAPKASRRTRVQELLDLSLIHILHQVVAVLRCGRTPRVRPQRGKGNYLVTMSP